MMKRHKPCSEIDCLPVAMKNQDTRMVAGFPVVNDIQAEYKPHPIASVSDLQRYLTRNWVGFWVQFNAHSVFAKYERFKQTIDSPGRPVVRKVKVVQ